MNLPNYKDGSIVNLMSSISYSFKKKSKYAPLKLLPPKDLKNSKNVVLIVLDGIGFEYILNKGKNTIFQKYLKGKITSVFPPTTASAITTFATGTAPQQHAFTGWFMHLKEIGVVSTILPFTPRVGGAPFSNYEIKMEEILDADGFTSKLNASSYTVTKKGITDSDFTKATSKKSKILGYTTLNGFFNQIKRAINSNNRRKYIYAYWSEFDSISHDLGVNSKKAEKHFKELNKKLDLFIKNIKNTNTALIITSDHGFIDSRKKDLIDLKNHPKLRECLTLPLCGEGRTAYCYVHPSKTKQFENYVNTKLRKFCDIYKSEDLIRKKYFGLFKENPKLLDRIGDYVLIMKKNYVFKDNLLSQKRNIHIGNHGGISKEEMLVPLIVVNV